MYSSVCCVSVLITKTSGTRILMWIPGFWFFMTELRHLCIYVILCYCSKKYQPIAHMHVPMHMIGAQRIILCNRTYMYKLSREGIITQEILLTLGCTKAIEISKTHFVWWERTFFLLTEFWKTLKKLGKPQTKMGTGRVKNLLPNILFPHLTKWGHSSVYIVLSASLWLHWHE